MNRLLPKALNILSATSIASILISPSLASINAVGETLGTDKDRKEKVRKELVRIQREILPGRPYEINKYKSITGKNIILKPFQLIAGEIPDWWSEKQKYDLSSLLYQALILYPGLSIEKPLSWEQFLLQNELDQQNLENAEEITDKEFIPGILRDLTRSVDSQITVQGFVDDYTYQILKPRKRGIGLGIISLTSKSCKAETYILASFNISDEKPTPINPGSLSKNSRDQFKPLSDMETVIKSQSLLTSSSGGSSLNINLGLGGFGGGKFQEPEKLTKEAIYTTIVDAAEGIFCSLSENSECNRYYRERIFKQPSLNKNSNYDKGDKSC